MSIKERVNQLKNSMRDNDIDAYVVPSYDAHQSEYLAEHWKTRKWITGFTGSAGTAVITQGECGLWTDGRYFIQAEHELEGSGIKLFKMGEKGVPTVNEFLKNTVKEDSNIGLDAKVFPLRVLNELIQEVSCKNIKIKDCDLIDEIWEDRPSMPMTKVFEHDVKYCGKSRVEKLADLREEMQKDDADYEVISSLDDIAWLYNIRGNDIHNNPYVISFTLVSKNEAILFVDDRKLDDEIRNKLENDGITIRPYEEVGEYLKRLEKGTTICLDPVRTSFWLYSVIADGVNIIKKMNSTTFAKSIKNDTEIKNIKECQIKDGVAMVKFIKWLKKAAKEEKIDELSVSDKLTSFRAQIDTYVTESFDSIVAYQANAAMAHYKATPQSYSEVKAEGFLLVDSGGQYYDGTTDITRTIVLGELTEDQIEDFTYTLKGHINLARAKFLQGCTGDNLDVLARQPLWQVGKNYNHGTGHGIGFFLGVHEGPQNISLRRNDNKLYPGMLISNEPGMYIEGKYGIRIENMILASKDYENEYGTFMRFDTLSFCPIDLGAVDVNLLTDIEKAWLNNYHKEVYEKLSIHLNEEEKKWLANETREI